jgi:Ca2+-binding RTX toxin-like protein
MELLLILLPLAVLGLAFDGGGSDDAPSPPAGQDGSVTRDSDAASALSGDADNNMILGAGGNDSLSGGDGTDVLLGELGADLLEGGNGDDLLLGAWGNDELVGGAGDDALIGGSGNDDLIGGAGSDLLLGSSGGDALVGGDGDDLLIGLEVTVDRGPEDLAGLDLAAFEEELRSYIGDDLTEADLRRATVGLTNGSSAESVPDLLQGDAGNDTLVGDDGDVISGGTGVDDFAVLAQSGADITTIIDFDPALETLAVLVDGPATGALTFANDAAGDGLNILLNGQIVANLEGVSANQIRAGSLTIQSLS